MTLADWIGPLLVAAGFGLYMATNVSLARFRRMPWEFLAVSALGVLHALGHWIVSPGTASAVSALVTFALFGLLVWFFFFYSIYGAREDRPRIGDRFVDFRLPTSDGGIFDFGAERGKRHLLIFYRGSW
ncbi:MAG: hypothetical protein ACREQQ_06075 [Candidatus Binatia bacterium]